MLLLLLVLRFVQGIAMGCEWSGAASLAIEHAPATQRGLYGSAMHAAAPLGTILSSGVVAILTTALDPADLIAWGWRIPFLLSAL